MGKIIDTGESLLTTEQFIACFHEPAFFAMLDLPGPALGNKVYSYFKDGLTHELDVYNALPHKRGIFFTPNGEFALATDRTKTSGRSFSYLVLDFDGLLDDEERAVFLTKLNDFNTFLDIDCRFVVRTKRGYHLYYKFAEPFANTKELSDLYRKLYDAFTHGISAGHGDPSCTDISRVFRLPGYVYWKDNRGELRIYVAYENPLATIDHKVLAEGYLKSFTKKSDDLQVLERERIFLGDGGSDFVDQVNSLSIGAVLDALNYKHIGATIYEDGEVTDGWRINSRENYVNNFTKTKPGRPTGGPYSFIKAHFDGDLVLMHAFLKEHFDKEVKALVEPPMNLNTSMSRIRYQDRQGASLVIDTVKKKTYMLDKRGNEFEAANFYIEPIGLVLDDEGTLNGRILIRVRGTYDTKIIPLTNKSGGISFAEEVKKLGPFSWNAFSPELVSAYHNYIYDVVAERPFFDNRTIGFNQRDNFIAGGTVITREEGVTEPDGSGFYKQEMLTNLTPIFRPPVGPLPMVDHAKAQINRTFNQLREYYEPGIIVPLTLMGLLGLITPYLRREGMAVPYGSLFGVTQTGKTTISELVKSAILKDYSERLSAASTTLLPLQDALRHGKTIFVGEFRGNNPVTAERIYNVLRDTFDGSSAKRGQSDLSTVTWQAVGTVIIDGEHIIDDPATFSRGIFMHCRENYKKLRPDRKKLPCLLPAVFAMLFSRIAKHEQGSAEYFQSFHALANTYSELLNDAFRPRQIMTTGECDRVLDNYGLLLAFADEIGLEMPQVIAEMDQTISDQLQMLGQRGARSQMLDDLAKYIMMASEHHTDFVNFPSDQLVEVNIHSLSSWLEIDRRMPTHRLESIVLSLNGEAGFSYANSHFTIHIDQLKKNIALKLAIQSYAKTHVTNGAQQFSGVLD